MKRTCLPTNCTLISPGTHRMGLAVQLTWGRRAGRLPGSLPTTSLLSTVRSTQGGGDLSPQQSLGDGFPLGVGAGADRIRDVHRLDIAEPFLNTLKILRSDLCRNCPNGHRWAKEDTGLSVQGTVTQPCTGAERQHLLQRRQVSLENTLLREEARRGRPHGV